MGFVTTDDDVRIFYKDWGPKDAQPIVFHHGWPLSSDDWDAQMLFFLSKGYRVVAHDRRGHGRSEQVATVTTRQSRRTIASVAWTGIGEKVGEARLVHVLSRFDVGEHPDCAGRSSPLHVAHPYIWSRGIRALRSRSNTL